MPSEIDIFHFEYLKLEARLLSIWAQYHLMVHHGGEEYQSLKPFFEYLQAIKNDTRDIIDGRTKFKYARSVKVCNGSCSM